MTSERSLNAPDSNDEKRTKTRESIKKDSAGSGTPDTSPLKGDQAASDRMQVDAEERNLKESDASGNPEPDVPKLKRSTRVSHQSQPWWRDLKNKMYLP